MAECASEGSVQSEVDVRRRRTSSRHGCNDVFYGCKRMRKRAVGRSYCNFNSLHKWRKAAQRGGKKATKR
jgi:hypothetical protein